MARVSAALVAGIVAVVLLGGAALGQEGVTPDPVAAVRAIDARFADLPTFEEAIQEANTLFDYAPVLGGSWVRVLDTFNSVPEQVAAPQALAWTDLGLGFLVEVMLVEDCPPSLKEAPTEDPCAWRHTWVYQVRDTGEVVWLAEAGDPIAQPS